MERLSALDASLLYPEQPTTPMHVGAVALFRRPRNGLAYGDLLRLIEQRITLVPRYRQKVRHVPASLARPVWVDDPDFDLTYHVRRSALPKPGSDRSLNDLVAPGGPMSVSVSQQRRFAVARTDLADYRRVRAAHQYAAGAKMLEMFPVVPLARGRALAIGMTWYDGGVCYGFNADRDAMGDVEMLAGMIPEALDELVGSLD